MSRPPELAPREAEQIAFLLGAPAVDVAFLRATQGLYFAHRETWPPISPVLGLLSGIHELEPQCARWIVRNPVSSTATASATCAGAVRLGGRRLRSGLVPADHGVSLAHLPLIDAGAAARRPLWARPALTAALQRLIERGPGRADDVGWMELALELAAQVERSGIDPASGRSDRPIAALLVGPDNGLLAWATHRGSRNAMRHAEINLVEGWLVRTRSGLPQGATLYATLKPCRACAGLIWDAALDPRTLRVLYAADDPGRVARETVLDAGSAERRRAVSSVEDARLQLSWQVDPGGPGPGPTTDPAELTARLTADGARA